MILNSRSLVPLGNICNYRCTVELIQENIYVTKTQKFTICGNRNHKTGLWEITFDLTTQKQIEKKKPPCNRLLAIKKVKI